MALPKHVVLPPPPPLSLKHSPLLQRLLKGVSMNAVFIKQEGYSASATVFLWPEPQTGS